ncbi:MAG TPA: hypothetical protein VG458_08080, partial [Solirubrobacterales bacterium]|nr:hypothetical protein [Solirubrobacterales bacterium]
MSVELCTHTVHNSTGTLRREDEVEVGGDGWLGEPGAGTGDDRLGRSSRSRGNQLAGTTAEVQLGQRLAATEIELVHSG